jgi:hypothetical protein
MKDMLMKDAFPAVVRCLLAAAGNAVAQSSVSGSTQAPASSVPLERLVTMIARKTGKGFVLNPRVHADVILIERDPSETS